MKRKKCSPDRNAAWRSRITATCASATSSNVIEWRPSSARCKSKPYKRCCCFIFRGVQEAAAPRDEDQTVKLSSRSGTPLPLPRPNRETIEKPIMPRHHKKDTAPGGSQRQLRVGETVRHAIAEILSHGSVHDAELEGHIVTVPEVRMSPDLKLATIYVMPLGGQHTELVIAALERNKKFLRGEIARRV